MVLLRPFCRQPHLSLLSLWLAKCVSHTICFRHQCLLKASISLWVFQLPAIDNKSHWLLKSTLHCHSQWLSSSALSNYHKKGCLSARFSSPHKYLFPCHLILLKKASRSCLIKYLHSDTIVPHLISTVLSVWTGARYANANVVVMAFSFKSHQMFLCFLDVPPLRMITRYL